MLQWPARTNYMTKSCISNVVDLVADPTVEQAVDELRRFNRFHSGFVGALRSDFLGTKWSLLEARILYEVEARGPVTQTDIVQRLGVDQGYLSRILTRMREERLLDFVDSDDARRKPMVLSKRGRKAFRDLDRRSQAEMTERIDGLDPAQRTRLVDALRTARDLLEDEHPEPVPRIRTHQPGDLGWVFMRHGEAYTDEFHYEPEFETYVATGLPGFLEGYRPGLDGLWIATLGGRRVGSIAIQHDPNRPRWAKLRWLWVEQECRGTGIGQMLMDTAIEHCRAAAYQGIYLWTMSDLDAARALYERNGFTLVGDAPAPWHETEVQQQFELVL